MLKSVIAGGIPCFPEFDFSAYGFDSLFGLITSLFNAVEEAVEEIAGEEEEEEPELNPPPYPGDDPTQSPGEDWEWRGQPGSVPGDKNGNWYNPKTGESLSPDLDHPPPIEPHWDWRAPDGKWYRYYPNGSLELKT